MTGHIAQVGEAFIMLEAKFGHFQPKTKAKPRDLIEHLRSKGVSAFVSVDTASMYTGKRLRLWRWALGLSA